MEKRCEFNYKERCTWMGDECLHPDKVCFATVRKGMGVVMPKMTVMQPTVVNESNTIPSSENVALSRDPEDDKNVIPESHE